MILLRPLTPRFSSLLLSVLMLSGIFITSAALAQEPLRPYVAEYDLLRAGSPAGKATIALEKAEGDTWRLRSHTRGTHGLAALAGFDVRETSIFRETPQGLACIRYDYRLSGLRKRERQVECGAGAIVSRDHRTEHRFSPQPGIVDRQIVSLALGRDLAAGRREALSYPVVDRERLEAQHYRVLGEETIEVPAGKLRAVKVARVRDDNDRTTITWFGADNGLVPVRILQSDEGEGFELRLISLKR